MKCCNECKFSEIEVDDDLLLVYGTFKMRCVKSGIIVHPGKSCKNFEQYERDKNE